MRGLVRDSVVEMFDRKTVWIFLAVTLIGVVVAVLTPQVDMDIRMEGNMDFGSLGDYLRNPVTMALSGFLAFVVFLTVMATAGVIPTMLVRGRADYYLSKPISRAALLLNKTLSVWLVYGAMIMLCGVIFYIALVLAHGLFDWRVLYLFGLYLVSLFIWLSVTITVGVVSGSTAIAMMSAFLVWVAQKILHFHEEINAFVDSRPVGYVIDALYYIVPKTGELAGLIDALALGKPVDSWLPLYSSLMFAFACTVLAVVVFKRKNY